MMRFKVIKRPPAHRCSTEIQMKRLSPIPDRINIKTIFPLGIWVLLAFLVSGCGQMRYLSKLGWRQASISFRSIPIQEVLEEGRFTPEIQEKIRLIQEIKRYGEEEIGLKKTENYLRYFEVKGPVVYVVTASEKDQLKLKNWWYPIIGRVTYKGFFSKQEAIKEVKALEEKNYDTCLQPAAAYSTLGWLKDPIFSSMLKGSPGALANLILHEMTHATVYFKGRTNVSEQIATFVGNRGAIDFLSKRYGPESEEVLQAVREQEDDLLFSQWIDQAYEQLSRFYGQALPKEEKLREREGIFQTLQESFVEMRPRFKTECYRSFESRPLNNAILLAYRQYVHRLGIFERLYAELGCDLRKLIGLMEQIRSSGEDPAVALDCWMKERKITASSSPR